MIAPHNPKYLDTRAEVFHARGELGPAIAVEQWLTAQHPQNEHYREQLSRFEQAVAERGPSPPPPDSAGAEGASGAAPQPTIAGRAEIDLVSWDPSSGAAVTPGDYLSLRVEYSTESLQTAYLQASLEIILTIHGNDLSLTTEPVPLSSATGELTLWSRLDEPLNKVAAWSAVRARGRLLVVDGTGNSRVVAQTEMVSWVRGPSQLQ